MHEAAEHLFDTDGFQVAAPARIATADGALDLDKKPTLINCPDDDNYARVVCLHSMDKAHYASKYADIVGTGMRHAFTGPLVWIELFAGPGVLFVKDLHQFCLGSPLQAGAIRNPFDQYVFVDMDVRCVGALRARTADWSATTVLEGNANSARVLDQIANLVPRDALVVLYADPAALSFEFDTVKFFADRYKHLDLLINYPVPWMDRALSAGAEAKAAKVLNHPRPAALIGPGSGRPGPSLREWYQRQLEGLGYEHFCREVIRLYGKNVPLYDLMLASRNPKAEQFFSEVQKRGPGGQYRLDF